MGAGVRLVNFPQEPAVFARFLCGVSSPRLARAKLTSNSLFGRLADMPYRNVLQLLEHELQAE